ALELGGGPGDRLVYRAAGLCALPDHLRHDRLEVHLPGDRCWRGRAGDPRYLVLARWVVIERALRGSDLLPDLEVMHALERRDVVTETGVDERLDVLTL